MSDRNCEVIFDLPLCALEVLRVKVSILKKSQVNREIYSVTTCDFFFIALLLNQSPSPPQQYSRSKDQDAAEDREDPCTGATGGG
jgi:hypothetical protein